MGRRDAKARLQRSRRAIREAVGHRQRLERVLLPPVLLVVLLLLPLVLPLVLLVLLVRWRRVMLQRVADAEDEALAAVEGSPLRPAPEVVPGRVAAVAPVQGKGVKGDRGSRLLTLLHSAQQEVETLHVGR